MTTKRYRTKMKTKAAQMKTGMHENLGKYLKDRREESELTQSEVAKKLGYSTPQFISNFERGLCAPPLKNLKTLIKLYKINGEDLLKILMKEQESIYRKALSLKNKR